MFAAVSCLTGIVAFATAPLPGADLKQTLQEVRPALRSKSMKDRVEALRKIAAISKDAPSPSPDVALALAVGLEDDQVRVRMETVKLLVDHQDSETVLVLLIDALKVAERELKDADAGIRKAHKEAHSGPPVWPPPKESAEYTNWISCPFYFGLLLEALGHIQDERAEKALIAAMERPVSKTPAVVHSDACRGLLELRSVRSIEAAIEGLASLDAALKRTKDEEARRMSIGADMMLSFFDPIRRSGVDALYGRLAEAATIAGVPGPAEGDGPLAERWRTWLATNRGLFREKLGKTVGALEVTLRDRPEDPLGVGKK